MSAAPKASAERTRPNMPNYGISTKAEGMMSWDWVDEQMTKSRNYWICSTRPDGSPHAAPVWGVWVDGKLYFGSATTSRKARNIKRNPQIVVHLESGDDTVILEGRVNTSAITDMALLERIADAYGAKYPPYKPDVHDSNNPFFVFEPKRAFAWTEKDYPNTATRWTLE
jgi:nitroimidazol reductase NimA-like FMN-containing flavoprotein (pyridoxamine 5'-phosphate oxidase superfamily)